VKSPAKGSQTPSKATGSPAKSPRKVGRPRGSSSKAPSPSKATPRGKRKRGGPDVESSAPETEVEDLAGKSRQYIFLKSNFP